MANPGKAIAGIIITGAGVFISTLPGIGPIVGPMIMYYGANMLRVGVIGDPDAVGQGAKFTASSTQGSLPVIYGERKIAHHWADIRTHGTDNSWLDMMAGVCIAGESGKNIEAVTGIWLYEDELSVENAGAVMDNTDSAGQIINVIAKYWKTPDVHYRYNLGGGSDTQATDARMAALFPNEWGVSSTLDHQEGRGIVTCYHGFFWDKDEEDNVWARGQPDRDIKYTVRGALLYDPRYKTAGPDNDGWIWNYADNPALNQSGLDNHPGRNPALQVLDYLTSKRYGLGFPYAARGAKWGPGDQIDEQSFIDMANHCDEDVTTTGLLTNVTLPRYTSNAIISTGDSHKTNLERLLGTCNGMLAYEGGRFKILPRKVETPVSYEITEKEIIGEITVTREGTTVPNIITVRYPNQDLNYIFETITWPYDAFNPSQNGYLGADNNIPVEKNVDLVAVTDSIHAQHIAMTLLKELRQDALVEVLCRESALQLSVNDVVKVTYDSAGWTQKTFRVLSMEILSDNTIRLNLREYDANVYSLDPNADLPTVPGTNLPNPFTVTPPTNVVANCSAGYYLNDATFIPRVEITWTHSTDGFAHEEEVVYRRDADTEWTYTGIVKKIGDTAAVAWEGDLDIGETYWFGVFARNRIRVISAIAETASSCTITGPGDTPSDVTITASDMTCLEGITLSFDNPAVYTEPSSIGVREIGFYSVEIREQGAGATELDRWDAGTFLDAVFGTEWNYSFDKLTKGAYDLTVRRFDKYGAPATGPTEINLSLTAWPCTGFGEYDPEQLGSVILNGDFERAFSYWYSSAPARTAMESASPIGGVYSLKITADAAVDTDVSQTNDPANDEASGGSDLKYISTNPGELWTIGATAYTSGANQFALYVQFYDENKTPTSDSVVATWNDATATFRKRNFSTPTDSYYWRPIFRAMSGTGDCYVDQITAVSRDTTAPVAFYDIVHNGDGTATVTVRVYDLAFSVLDFDMRIWDVASQAWGAWVDDSDPSVTVTNINTYTNDYEWDVTLDEKHDTYTEYDVYHIVMNVPAPTDFFETAHIREVITLDIDTIPFVTNLQLSVRDDGSVDLDWGCDDDGNSIKYTKSTTSYTAAGDPTGGTTLNGTSGNASGIHTLAYGETLYVRTIAYTGATGTGDPGTKEAEAQITHLGGATYPVVQEQLSYSGANGVLDLAITDPDSRVTQVEFTTKSGLAAWSGWAVDTAPYQATVALTEKHDSHISWRVSFTKVGGATGVIEGNVTFDIDTNPEIMSLDLNIEDNGAARLSYAGDDDVASIKWATSTSAYPSGATVDAVTPPTNTNDGRTDSDVDLNAGTIASGDTLYVSFYAYSGTQASGTKSSQLYQIKRTRLSGTDTILPTVQAQITGAGNNEITLVLNDPQDLVTGVGFKKYERNGTTNVMEWGAWVDDTVAPYNLTTSLTRDEKHNTIVAWRVRYNPGTGNKYIENVIVYDPDLTPQVNSVDVDVDDSGDVFLSYACDDDTLSIKYKTDLTDFPTYAETTTTGTVVNFTSSDNINIGSLAEGATMFVSVAAYPAASGGGTANTKMGWGRVTRPTDTTGSGLTLSAFGLIKKDGITTVRWAGEGLASVRYTTNVGSAPACPTGGTGGTLNTNGVFTTSAILYGQSMFVSIVGYDVADGTGNETECTILEVQRVTSEIVGDNPAKIFYQTAQPSSGMVANDIWYETDVTPNAKYTYSGSAWVNQYNQISSFTTPVTFTSTVTMTSGQVVYDASNSPRTSYGNSIDLSFDRKVGMAIRRPSNVDGWNFVYGGTTPQYNLSAVENLGIYGGSLGNEGLAFEIGAADQVIDFKSTPTVNGTPVAVSGSTNADTLDNKDSTEFAILNTASTFTAAQAINAANPVLIFRDTVDSLSDVGPQWYDASNNQEWGWRFNGTDLSLYNHNGTPSACVTFALGTEVATFNQRPQHDASQLAAAVDDLDFFADVSYTPGLTTDDVLTWSGSAWEPQPAQGGSLTLNNLTNVTDTSSAANWYMYSTAAATWATRLGVPATDITGSINAANLGGIAASGYAVLAENETVTGNWIFSGNDFTFKNGSNAGFINYDVGGATADSAVWAQIFSGSGATLRWSWNYDYNDHDLYLEKSGTTRLMHYDFTDNRVEYVNRPTVGGTTVALSTDTPTLGLLSTHSDVSTGYGNGDLLYNSSGTWVGQTRAELGIVTNTDISVQGNGTHQGYLGTSDINFINGTNTAVTVSAGTPITVRVDATIGSLQSTGDVQVTFDTDNNGSNHFRVRGNGLPGTVFLELGEDGYLDIEGEYLRISSIGGAANGNTVWVGSDGTYAEFYARGGQHVQLRATSTADRFYLYNGTSRNYITPLYGFTSGGTGGPGAVSGNYGAIYLRHEV